MATSSPIAFVHPYTELVEPRIRAFIEVARAMLDEAISRAKTLFHTACSKRKSGF